MTRWDAARAASRRQLPKPRKMMGPVGGIPEDKRDICADTFVAPNGEKAIAACTDCGLHICSCEPEPSVMDGIRAAYAAAIAPMPDEPEPPKPIPPSLAKQWSQMMRERMLESLSNVPDPPPSPSDHPWWNNKA